MKTIMTLFESTFVWPESGGSNAAAQAVFLRCRTDEMCGRRHQQCLSTPVFPAQ